MALFVYFKPFSVMRNVLQIQVQSEQFCNKVNSYICLSNDESLFVFFAVESESINGTACQETIHSGSSKFPVSDRKSDHSNSQNLFSCLVFLAVFFGGLASSAFSPNFRFLSPPT